MNPSLLVVGKIVKQRYCSLGKTTSLRKGKKTLFKTWVGVWSEQLHPINTYTNAQDKERKTADCQFHLLGDTSSDRGG